MEINWYFIWTHQMFGIVSYSRFMFFNSKKTQEPNESSCCKKIKGNITEDFFIFLLDFYILFCLSLLTLPRTDVSHVRLDITFIRSARPIKLLMFLLSSMSDNFICLSESIYLQNVAKLYICIIVKIKRMVNEGDSWCDIVLGQCGPGEVRPRPVRIPSARTASHHLF